MHEKSVKINQLISTIPLDDKLLETIPMQENLIVRSAANLEDQANSAAAGIFTSVRVHGRSELKKAVLDVVTSAFSEKALAFFHDKPSASLFDMTLIFQTYVADGQYSGVGFSVANEKKWNVSGFQVVKGLGGGVDGTEVLSYFFVDATNQTFDDLRLVSNEELPCSFAVSKELALLLKELERRFNAPVEIEFVGKGNDVSIVQLRPITKIL
jgi:hypothetical protein